MWSSPSFQPSAHLLRVWIVQNTNFQVFKCVCPAHLRRSNVLMFRISLRVHFAPFTFIAACIFLLNTSILRIGFPEACNLYLLKGGSEGFQVKITKIIVAVFPRGSKKNKSNNDDKHDHGQEKTGPSTYVERKNMVWKKSINHPPRIIGSDMMQAFYYVT